MTSLLLLAGRTVDYCFKKDVFKRDKINMSLSFILFDKEHSYLAMVIIPKPDVYAMLFKKYNMKKCNIHKGVCEGGLLCWF